MFRRFSLILLALITFLSCREEKKPVKTSLLFEKEQIIKRTGENCDTAEYDCTVISLEVVKAKGAPEISKEINRKLEEHVIELVSSEEDPQVSDLEELSNNFILDYRSAAENFSEEPPWEAYVNENIYSKTENLVSIGITTEIFSGGAHGYKTLTFLNFDPNTGELYSSKDLFTPEFKTFVEEKFRQEQNIPQEENINSTGFWFKNDIFRLPSNIGFTEENVILVYNSYEIAPYSAGDIYMEIPLEEARPFLKIE
ncbi:DUF3298 and DUF4163 domain-containing protein [Salinimicrobium soli]|uniref:DUF3298 and DUF4163 domain-containing protein n=2 Tax=Bacteria TaxID=2 RepID=UPI003AB08429